MLEKIGSRLYAVRTTLGVAVEEMSVRAVAVRGGKVQWAAEMERTVGEGPVESFAAMLAHAKIRRWPLARVRIALGPGLVQIKTLGGLPAGLDHTTLTRLVAEGYARFFLRNASALVTSGVCLSNDGRAWAAAVERSVATELQQACRQARLRLEAIVPCVAVLGSALEDGSTLWGEGSVRSTVRLERRYLVVHRCRRVFETARIGLDQRGHSTQSDEGMSDPRLRADSPLRRLAPDGWRYAGAYGAAATRLDGVPAVRPQQHFGEEHAVPRWRLLAAATALMLAVMGAFFVPGLAATRAIATARARLGRLGTAPQVASAALHELSTMSRALGEVRSFAGNRRSGLLLLSDVTSALPDSAVVVTLHVDSAGGTVVALGSRAGDVVDALHAVPEIADPQIVGPVTRETLNSRVMERLTVRFRLRKGTRPSRDVPVAESP
ncbi:MAG TPA: hypothetical protein VFK13_14820 [Gemmatimonadaceae bacterium]|nr:hypothetical protein [Gemmatimonadaceae bacterium]